MTRFAYILQLLGSASIASAVGNTPERDSIILSESTISSRRSSDAPESSALGVTFSLPTDATPNSRGIIEPTGRLAILQIVTPRNKRCSINRGQTTNGFVGIDNPASCAFATTFNLAEGQLFQDGVPVYYSGESYKELAGQELAAPEDPTSRAITKFFEDVGRLVFRNSGLPSGSAGFCQTPDGVVYLTFTSGPSGYKTVNLLVYDVSQCQNGQLVGDDDLTSTISETVTRETTTSSQTNPTITSGIKETTATEVTPSSGTTNSEEATVVSSETTEQSVSLSSTMSYISQSKTTTAETTTAGETTTAEPTAPDTTTAETTTAEPTTTEITTSAAPTPTTPATGCSALGNLVTVEKALHCSHCNV
ncbi:hypothetical protein NXS19_014229 [Fusarium pseudograminearum]|nr:hypothetical protein NXS19_014229 [Fusarium pseudograminearum]